MPIYRVSPNKISMERFKRMIADGKGYVPAKIYKALREGSSEKIAALHKKSITRKNAIKIYKYLIEKGAISAPKNPTKLVRKTTREEAEEQKKREEDKEYDKKQKEKEEKEKKRGVARRRIHARISYEVAKEAYEIDKKTGGPLVRNRTNKADGDAPDQIGARITGNSGRVDIKRIEGNQEDNGKNNKVAGNVEVIDIFGTNNRGQKNNKRNGNKNNNATGKTKLIDIFGDGDDDIANAA